MVEFSTAKDLVKTTKEAVFGGNLKEEGDHSMLEEVSM